MEQPNSLPDEVQRSLGIYLALRKEELGLEEIKLIVSGALNHLGLNTAA